MADFWANLSKPILCLAPMADVTDAAFRQLIAKYAKPDIFFTEFVSADGLCSAGRDKLMVDLMYSKGERPIVAQIFGGNPENIKSAAKLCASLGFDGIDINMGCPDRSIEKSGAGAAAIKNPKLAKDIIRAAKEGGSGLPVSVKTRIGYNKNEIESWIPALLEENLAALTVHLRTRKEMSAVPAHWELMKRIVELRDKIAPKTLIMGNGDVLSLEEARTKCRETGCDGVMLGRAVFGNPFLFADLKNFSTLLHPAGGTFRLQNSSIPQTEEKLKVMLEHTKLFEKLLGPHKNFAIMKKHYKAYVNGFEGAKELRIRLMEAESASAVETITNDFLKHI